MHKGILNNMLELAKTNKLSGLEKVKKIYVTSEPMSIENDILTPTMKIKRNIAK
jgi:long-chain acyl-CoA synthetase